MTKSLSKAEESRLSDLLKVFEEFRVLDREMQMQQAVTLITIALNEGISLNELTERTQQASSSASRNVASLSTRNRAGKPGHGLVINREDPEDTRRKQHVLTTKGRTFLSRVASLID